MSQRIDVGVLGATGMVGQQFIAQLANHPWFRLTWLGASERSAGQMYRDAAPWRLPCRCPPMSADQIVQEARPGTGAPELVFSAMDASVAGEIEEAFARAGHVVVSNSRNHRMAPDVPLLVPEINSDHIALIEAQRRGTRLVGRALTNPNCSTVILSMALAPLRQYGSEVGPGHHAAGVVGRRLPWCRLPRRGGQRRAVHLGRGGQDRKRAEEDSRQPRAWPRRAAPGRDQRVDDAGGRRQRPHRVDCRRARRIAVARRGASRARRASAARPSATGCRPRRASPSSTCTKRTARSRGSTSIATAA